MISLHWLNTIQHRFHRSKTHALTLYFLDSGSYTKGMFDWFGFFTPTEYDWIRQSQIDWFLQESGRSMSRFVSLVLPTDEPPKASINHIERPFRPDTGKDIGSVWERQDDQVIPGIRRLAKPNALMFFHIPLYVKCRYDSYSLVNCVL